MILWPIRTFWYKGLAKIKETNQVWKKGLYSEKKVVRIKKFIFTIGSKNQWIWHLYNVFRTAKPIQIQPINQNVHKKIAKTQKPGLVLNQNFVYLFIIFCHFSLLIWLCVADLPSYPPACLTQGVERRPRLSRLASKWVCSPRNPRAIGHHPKGGTPGE